jgi:hypothetical protein
LVDRTRGDTSNKAITNTATPLNADSKYLNL